MPQIYSQLVPLSLSVCHYNNCIFHFCQYVILPIALLHNRCYTRGTGKRNERKPQKKDLVAAATAPGQRSKTHLVRKAINVNNHTTNTGEWKTEYQQRAEQTQARRRAAGMYRRPTQAQDQAYRRLIARGGWRNVTVEDAAILSTHPWLTCSQRAEYALMAAQRRFAAMLTAMVGDDDVDALIDEVYGKPGLGVEDSAGLVDYDAQAYALGCQDSATGRYSPPACNTEHDAYVRGWNDAWAATQPAVKLSR